MSSSLAAWPAVTDTVLEVHGRPVRILTTPSRSRGTDRPQLLVHGLGGSAANWVQVMEGLAEHGPVVAVDLPGFGRTSVSDREPLTVAGYVDFVLEVADALGWRRFTLHGRPCPRRGRPRRPGPGRAP